MKKPKPTAAQLAKAITIRSALVLKHAKPRERPRLIKERLHELNGVWELAYWLKLHALEKKIDAHQAELRAVLKRL